jgi:hypothetical protein
MLTSFLLLAAAFNLVLAETGHHALQRLNILEKQKLWSDEIESAGSSNIRIVDGNDLATVYIRNATIPIDHWNPSFGSYKNRFGTLDEFYKPGGPVLFFDMGESNAFPSANPATNVKKLRSRSFELQLIKEFNAVGIFWEHRYYGTSLPEHDHGKENPEKYFRYLTAEQALADVPFFAWDFSLPRLPNTDLTPAGTPWIFIGGSYPGMRAAWLRQEYPETIFASWASSAPVQATVDMSFYNDAIWDGLNAYGFGNCTKDIQAVVRYVDKELDNKDPNVSNQLKRDFLGEAGAELSHSDFAAALQAVLSPWQSRGAKSGDHGLGSFCDHISLDPTTNQVSDAQGWAAKLGPRFSAQRWVSSPEFREIVRRTMGYSNVDGTTNSGVQNSILTTRRQFDDTTAPRTNDQVSWAWQFCTEFGYFMTANIGPKQLVSKHIDIAWHQDYCHSTFKNQVPDLPAVEAINKRFGGWNINPPRTFWGGGKFDPWRKLSPLSDLPNAPQLQLRLSDHLSVSSCEASSTPLTPSRLFRDASSAYGVLSEGEHCADMDDNADEPRRLFADIMRRWQSCFEVGAAKRPDILKTGKRMPGPIF